MLAPFELGRIVTATPILCEILKWPLFLSTYHFTLDKVRTRLHWDSRDLFWPLVGYWSAAAASPSPPGRRHGSWMRQRAGSAQPLEDDAVV